MTSLTLMLTLTLTLTLRHSLPEGTGPLVLEQPFLTVGCGAFQFVKTHQAIHFIMYIYGNNKQNQTFFE